MLEYLHCPCIAIQLSLHRLSLHGHCRVNFAACSDSNCKASFTLIHHISLRLPQFDINISPAKVHGGMVRNGLVLKQHFICGRKRADWWAAHSVVWQADQSVVWQADHSVVWRADQSVVWQADKSVLGERLNPWLVSGSVLGLAIGSVRDLARGYHPLFIASGTDFDSITCIQHR